VKNFKDFIAYAQANPGKVNYGSAGTGTTTHLAGEMLEMTAKVDMNHIPYKGAAPVITDLLGGQIDASFLNIAGLQPHFDSGKLRPLAVSTPKRSALMPDLPSVAETYSDFDASSWYGVVAPAGTPKEIVAKLESEIRAILKQPEIAEFMQSRGLTVVGSTSEEYRARIRADIARWQAVVKAAGLAPKN
jgi:tripartite-type tricarboxylate transporter receptor subunit TctC